jgi:pimeloyl-ACP methyl ester carboxylesterase
VLWGTSYSGGHVVAVAARDKRVAAVISMTPATDGLAALAQIARYAGPGQLARATAHGLLDAARAAARRAPHHVPVVGPPGSAAIISTPGAEAGYLAIAGPTWRNQVCARSALQVGLNRPTTSARRLTCPILVQVGDRDRVAPPAAPQTRPGSSPSCASTPVDHFDAYQGRWQQRALADQLGFLSRTLAPLPATQPLAA